jgi:DNA-binding transcriptional regulator LsrR (DeoR family)
MRRRVNADGSAVPKGRRGVTGDDAVRYVRRLRREHKLTPRDVTEVISIVVEGFRAGKTALDIAAAVRVRFANVELGREGLGHLSRYAWSTGLFEFQPPLEHGFESTLKDRYDWLRSLHVVPAAHVEPVAREGAKRLLELIRDAAGSSKTGEVQVGVGGGKTLRRLFLALSRLLRKYSPHNPQKIVFRALVAALRGDDFEEDPNNYSSYFLRNGAATSKVAFFPLQMPGFCSRTLQDQLKQSGQIQAVYKATRSLQIIVTSAGNLNDEHSTLRRYAADLKLDLDELRKSGVVGDLLWQPYGVNGSTGFPTDVCTSSLLSLDDLARFVHGGYLDDGRRGRVLLVLGPCAKCQMDKEAILQAILQRHAPITDLVVASSTVRRFLQPSLG